MVIGLLLPWKIFLFILRKYRVTKSFRWMVLFYGRPTGSLLLQLAVYDSLYEGRLVV